MTEDNNRFLHLEAGGLNGRGGVASEAGAAPGAPGRKTLLNEV